MLDWLVGEFFRDVSDFNDDFSFGESDTTKVSANLCFWIAYLLYCLSIFLTFSLRVSNHLECPTAGSPGTSWVAPHTTAHRRRIGTPTSYLAEYRRSSVWCQRYPPQSPQTASGLHWQHSGSDNTTFMLDMCTPDDAARSFSTSTWVTYVIHNPVLLCDL